ncbi:MAG: MBL fold metallo-hydrolase [Pseudomonadota bacterium]
MSKMGLGAAIGVVFLIAGCVAAPGYQGPKSDHFDGNVFRNTLPAEKGFWDLVRMGWGSVVDAQDWPGDVPNGNFPAPADDVVDDIVVTYVNHSTVLVQVAGVNILTDPVYSERVSPFTWAGPKRVRAPGIALEELPHIDVILISHNHYDHLDAKTLQDISAQQSQPPLILAGLGNTAFFAQLGLEETRDMDWDDQIEHAGLSFHFVECRHRSGRGITDQMKTLWGSFVIETPQGNIYFGGDTGYSPHFKAQGARFEEFALTILPIGAYEPRWFMADIHLNPADAVQAHLDLNSRQSLGIHFGVFQLTYEGIDQPALDLSRALDQAELSQSTFWVLEPGMSRTIAQTLSR